MVNISVQSLVQCSINFHPPPHIFNSRKVRVIFPPPTGKVQWLYVLKNSKIKSAWAFSVNANIVGIFQKIVEKR